MQPLAIREFLVGLLEDHERDGVIPASLFEELAISITESWIKDRRRSIAEARDVPF